MNMWLPTIDHPRAPRAGQRHGIDCHMYQQAPESTRGGKRARSGADNGFAGSIIMINHGAGSTSETQRGPRSLTEVAARWTGVVPMRTLVASAQIKVKMHDTFSRSRGAFSVPYVTKLHPLRQCRRSKCK